MTLNPRRLRPLAALLLAVVAGCSQVQFLYAQVDWLLLRWVEEYLDLGDRQRDRLKGDIADLHTWHCRVQLPQLGTLLGDFDADVGQGRLAPARVGAYAERAEALWSGILDHAAPATARLLADLSADQLEDLYRALEKGNAAAQRKIRKRTPSAVAADYADGARDEFERWLGPLNRAQRDLIADWSRALRPLGLTGLDYRRAWQDRLRPLIAGHRGEPGRMEAMLRDSFARIVQDQPPAYRETLSTNRTVTYAMVAAVIAPADETQRAHLHRFVSKLRTDLAAIRCD